LSPEQAEDYSEFIDNDRRLRAVVHEIEMLTLGVVEDDPRWKR
jgi:hypothetical protein